MALSGSKRGRSSESPPPRRDGVPPSPATECARERSQNRSLALESEPERNNEVQVGENTSSSIMSLGLETKEPAERRSSSGFGEFLKACGLCKKKIGDQSAYMFGNFKAFCKPECQAKAVRLFYKEHLSEAGLPEHLGVNVKQR